jgi:outer membrane protein assembly factor BamC
MSTLFLIRAMNQRYTTASLFVLPLLVSGCSALQSLSDDVSNNSKVNYRQQAAKTQALDIPPDLAQLARENRFAVQNSGGSISASQFAQTTGAAAAPRSGASNTSPLVAPKQVGSVKIVREGQDRWILTSETADQVYPKLLSFWSDQGFSIQTQSPETGIIETNWNENRAKIPQDFIRNTLGKVLDGLWSSGERDQFRTRIERTPQGTEISISHRGMQEVYTSNAKDQTRWTSRPRDPELEIEFLSRLLLALGGHSGAQNTTAAAAKPTSNAQNAVASTASNRTSIPKVRSLQNGAQLEIKDDFDRAWRKVGSALDRSGFTIEDRDRSAGTYFIRYTNQKSDNQSAGMLSKVKNLFSSDTESNRPERYRLALETQNNQSLIRIIQSSGNTDTSPAAVQILKLLADELNR